MLEKDPFPSVAELAHVLVEQVLLKVSEIYSDVLFSYDYRIVYIKTF